jgi:glycosyltransferase involved in cell wall biosynthesis
MTQNKLFYNKGILVFGDFENAFQVRISDNKTEENAAKNTPEILFLTSYPPRECGIATYSQDLIIALENKFKNSFKLNVCALETNTEKHTYSEKIKYILNTDQASEFDILASNINENPSIKMVFIQHEFGLFAKNELAFYNFLVAITKPIIFVFHTVLPKPDAMFLSKVQQLIRTSEAVIVMTKSSAKILKKEYHIAEEKINVIAHGTHLVSQLGENTLKKKYNLTGKKVLSTFGLLSSGKCIETTLNALPSIIKKNPDVIFLILGKTHPSVLKNEGEKYRKSLEAKIINLKLSNNVRFVNQFLPLTNLLEYLQLTDIYLFTSKDPNQAVSGTFAYALSCGCPIVSTPIPHAIEILNNNAGKIVDFENSKQLSKAVNLLLKDEELRNTMGLNAFHMMAPTAWENSAIAHARLFEKINNTISLQFRIPEINLAHIKKLTTETGMIQFSIINQPDINSGYTLDDNARALVAMCQHYEMTCEYENLESISTYLDFIKSCQLPDGYFLNYINELGDFTEQNNQTNLADSNGRAIWALGYLISLSDILPQNMVSEAQEIMQNAVMNAYKIHSSRAMAFIIKGLYYSNLTHKTEQNLHSIRELANRLLQMYRHEASKEWQWYESYLTYANSILPEAMLCAYLATGDTTYKQVAVTTFDFLIEKIFSDTQISVISNKNWLQKNQENKTKEIGGEQAIDVAYTILALNKFYLAFNDEKYKQKMNLAFSWFLGNNYLNQIIYNPCTGGCYDGLEDIYVNLNQGAESTVSYQMARLTIEKMNGKPVNNVEIRANTLEHSN